MKSAGKALGNALKAAYSGTVTFAKSAWPWIVGALVLLLAAFAFWRWWRRRARSPAPGDEDRDAPKYRAAQSFERMVSVLAKAGVARSPAQTALEFGRRADSFMGFDLGGRAAALFNKARFAPDPGTAELDELDEVVGRIEVEVADRKKPRASKRETRG